MCGRCRGPACQSTRRSWPSILSGRRSSATSDEAGLAAALSKRRHTLQAIRAGMVTADKRHETTPCSWAAVLLTFTLSMACPTCSMSRLKSRGSVRVYCSGHWSLVEGINLMERRRGTDKLIDLARGPGRLALALQIDRSLDGIDMCADGPLWLGTAVRKTGRIGTSTRIGITREVGRLLRFFEVGSPFVSGPRALSMK